MAKFLTIKDAAEYAGLTGQQVRRYFDYGVFDGFKSPGGHREISVESIEAFLREPKQAVRRAQYRRGDIKEKVTVVKHV